MPLNRQFCAADGSANATEMAQLQRMARSTPPLRVGCAAAADTWEQAAELSQFAAKETHTVFQP